MAIDKTYTLVAYQYELIGLNKSPRVRRLKSLEREMSSHLRSTGFVARKRNLLLFLGFIAVFLNSGETAQAQTRYHVGCNSDGCIVDPWDGPEVAIEFTIRRLKIEPGSQFFTERDVAGYRKAETERPNVESCLNKDALTHDGFDLAKINWARFDNHYSVYVCFFRLGSVLSDEDKINVWLKSIGFESSLRPRTNKTWARVHGIWQGSGRSPFVTPKMWFWTKVSWKRFFVTFDLDEARRVNEVHFGFPNRLRK